MNNNNGREMKILVVAALIISIVAIGIGFAAFSQNLTINGSASVQTSSWKVKFSDLSSATLTGTAAEVTKPTLSDTTIETYNVTFKTPGDSVSYKIKVSNTGSYNAKITTATIPVPTCTGKSGETTAEADAGKVCDKLTYTFHLRKDAKWTDDKPVTAKGLYAICKDWSKKFGKYEEIQSSSDYVKTNYIPNNPQQYLIVVVDHVKLLSVAIGHTSKQEIDEACDYLIHFRNKCSFKLSLWYID